MKMIMFNLVLNLAKLLAAFITLWLLAAVINFIASNVISFSIVMISMLTVLAFIVKHEIMIWSRYKK